MITALASAFNKRSVKPFVAMTGETTLRGKVLPVGGIKEKILAAKRSGIKEIILCSKNKKDIDEIEETYIAGDWILPDEDIKMINALLEKHQKDLSKLKN